MSSGLPDGWIWATVADISDVQLGRQRSPQHHAGEQMRPYLRAANVTWQGICLNDVNEMNFDDADFKKYRLSSGDILLNEASGSPHEVGKPVIWNNEIEGCCFQNTLLRLRPQFLNRDYVYWYCYTSALTGRFGEAGRGVNIRHLGKRGLSQFPIPVAPLAEQERIVAAIEEHFSRLDAVEHDITTARAKGATLPSVVLPGLFLTDWPTRKIGELARVGSGATPRRSEARFWSGGTIPWVTSGAVNERAIRSASGFITEEALAETSVKLWPIGTVLVAMYGEGKTRGKAALLQIESTCNQACAAIDYDRSLVTGDYLLTYLNSQYEASRRLASGGVQPNLSLGLIKNMEIPVPSLETQRSVALQAEDIMLGSEQLAATCTKARLHVTALRRSILAAAFSGQLVPQDPQDEPASALLERIAASRTAKSV